ncbi:Lon protease-like protein, mitochondrial [Smittium culicis]|uniref:Lon protease homolog, mitochondrial n=1 Tax=Smittium culicis TaxID=133412 RepID=A0A1R1YTJ5_9FUNG|nr:Lon protease-like protein, mitochondrial [Smittium culicis]
MSVSKLPAKLLSSRLIPRKHISLKSHILSSSIFPTLSLSLSSPFFSKPNNRPFTSSSSLFFKASSFLPKDSDKKKKPPHLSPKKDHSNEDPDAPKSQDSSEESPLPQSKLPKSDSSHTSDPPKHDSPKSPKHDSNAHSKPSDHVSNSPSKSSENNSKSPSKASDKDSKASKTTEKASKTPAEKKAQSKDSPPAHSDSKPITPSRNPLDQLRQAVGVSDSSQLNKIEVPDTYDKLFILPIARRPLFPGFYKAVVIKDPNVILAIKDLLKRGEPFVGAFMLKDEQADVDYIDNVDQVYQTGVFAQITSVFPSTIQEEDSLTVVLYSHRRIGLSSLLNSSELLSSLSADQSPSNVSPLPDSEDTPQNIPPPTESVEHSIPQDKEKLPSELVVAQVLSEYNFLVGQVDNLPTNLSKQKSQIVRAVTSEIVSVFKEISTLNPLFRDQIASFSMSQSAGNVFEEPSRLADFSAAVSSGEPSELQEILDELEIEKRLEKALVVLKKEFLNAQLQNKISKDVEAKISKRQREFYLMEQLRGIKRELGLESDGKDKLIEQFKSKILSLNMPDDARKVFDEEITKLAHLEPSASEFNVTRNYLDWLTQIPWGKHSVENFDIKHAKQILDEDHFGLEDIKDRILEFVAVGKLRGLVQGKILCFVGPPGVGKTSIGKSISRALDRSFYRFSVGGLSDVAEIKGHRRTYVGAMPGKVIQALKKAGTENPLILIDEIDKLGRGHQGDPASALLELLDPEQNASFLDHYMDVPIDLSRVLFVCTANTIDTIPGPLLDRMEIIRLSGYLAEEKLEIAKQYLIPQAKVSCGLEGSNVSLTDKSIDTLVKNYCRESGVRNLKKHIEKIFRKATLNIVKQDIAIPYAPEPILSAQKSELDQDGATGASIPDQDPPITTSNSESEVTSKSEKNLDKSSENSDINASDPAINIPKDPNFLDDFFDDNNKKVKIPNAPKELVNRPMTIPDSFIMTIDQQDLKSYIGPPLYTTDRLYSETKPGVIMGLAWTSLGGSSLYIESIVVHKNKFEPSGDSGSEKNNNGHFGNLITTGQLGDVMKESTKIAYTYSQSLLNQLQPDNDFFKTSAIHLHVPEGATPKDGPSAGVTMTTSLLSLALNQSTDPNVAMTGEITLTGKVLKIGGLREKVIAAKRSGITRVLFPIDNIPDWEDLPMHVKEGVEGCPINFYTEIPPLVGLKL